MMVLWYHPTATILLLLFGCGTAWRSAATNRFRARPALAHGLYAQVSGSLVIPDALRPMEEEGNKDGMKILNEASKQKNNPQDDFFKTISKYVSEPDDLQLLHKIYQRVAKQDDSDGNWRLSLATAQYLAEMKLDVPTLATALLYKSTVITKPTHSASSKADTETKDRADHLVITPEMRELLQSWDNVDSIQAQFHASLSLALQESENFRKIVITVANDVRVLLLKLTHQAQVLRFLVNQDNIPYNNTAKHPVLFMPEALAQETLHVYAPLAHRLGMYTLKTELEDMSLRLWKPQLYKHIQDLVATKQFEREEYTQKVIRRLRRHLANEGLPRVEITGRPKSLFSIYQKMQNKGLAFDDIHDLMAFRILVDDVPTCYHALGLIHACWKPVGGRFKDYIAISKPNGYQSLHTTVIGPESKPMEVQIRTHAMHQIAEGGVAAHWAYKDSVSAPSIKAKKSEAEAERYRSLRKLVEWAMDTNNDNDSLEDTPRQSNKISTSFDSEEIFVFSPQGQLLSLRNTSTVLDFAYRIHSELGHHCLGGKVNGKMVKLNHVLKTGDRVEILQSPNQTPKQEWLAMVTSSKAQQRIRAWLKKQQIGSESVALGREILENTLKKYASRHKERNFDATAKFHEHLEHILDALDLEDEDSLYRCIAYGQIRVKNVIQQVSEIVVAEETGAVERDEFVYKTLTEKSDLLSSPTTKSDGVVIGGKRNILISYCRECNPLYGEAVKGYVTQGRGVKVHRTNCRYIQQSDPDRHIQAVWDTNAHNAKRKIRLDVLFDDSPGMLAAMSAAISACKVNILGVVLKTLSNGRGLARFEVMLASVDELLQVTRQLNGVLGVLRIERR